jgi:hypothetical protein
VLPVDAALCHPSVQHVEPLLVLTAADNLANARCEHVHCCDSSAGFFPYQFAGEIEIPTVSPIFKEVRFPQSMGRERHRLAEVRRELFVAVWNRQLTTQPAWLSEDRQSTGQVDDGRRNTGQQPVWFKSINDVDHTARSPGPEIGFHGGAALERGRRWLR